MPIIIHNIQASNTEIMWILRLAIVGSGAVSTLLTITVNNVLGLMYLAVDGGLFVLLPELFCSEQRLGLPDWSRGRSLPESVCRGATPGSACPRQVSVLCAG